MMKKRDRHQRSRKTSPSERKALRNDRNGLHSDTWIGLHSDTWIGCLSGATGRIDFLEKVTAYTLHTLLRSFFRVIVSSLALLQRLFLYPRSLLPRFSRPSEESIPFKKLTALTDWVPSATLRKRLRKLIADEFVEIMEFRSQGRTSLARWRTLWTYVHWLRYLLVGPLVSILKSLTRLSVN